MRWRESLIARCCRRATRRSGLVLAVAAALLALGVRAQGGRQDDRFSPEPVEVRIGGSVYAIPRNYLVHVYTDIDGETGGIVMRALWPGLEPLRPDNAHLWEGRQPERQIHFGLMRRPRDGHKELQGFKEFFKPRRDPAEFGFSRYVSGIYEYYIDENNPISRPDRLPIVLKCYDLDQRIKLRFQVKRSCTVEYPLSDSVGLHYRFFMVNLEHWREIDAAVRLLVEGLRKENSR